MSGQKLDDPLALLVRSANLCSAEVLEQAVKDARRLSMPLERALVMSNLVSSSSLELVLKARDMVNSGKLTVNAAIKALRLSQSEHISLEDALKRLRDLHKRTATTFALFNDLTMLITAAGIVSSEQMSLAVAEAQRNGMLAGRVLRLNRVLSTFMLASSVRACMMIRAKKIRNDDALEGLKRAHRKRITIEQALFELGLYKQPESYSMSLEDLLAMAGILLESALLECWELCIVKNKSFKQVVLEQGLVTQGTLDLAFELQGMVTGETLKPYMAAAALRRVVQDKVSIYQAVAEQQTEEQRAAIRELKIGILLSEAGLVSGADADEAASRGADSDIRIGKVLLHRGLVREDDLLRALRLQSLWRHGYISAADAIPLLKSSSASGEPLEITIKQAGLYLPSSMQWTWV